MSAFVVLTAVAVIAALAPILGKDTRTPEMVAEEGSVITG